jgi:hypothetical protein
MVNRLREPTTARPATALRWLAVVFLLVAAVNAVVAVCDSVVWPAGVAVVSLTAALGLEGVRPAG